MTKKEELTESLYFRHACKLFDENRKIPFEDLNFILEAGRLSPSSFGMEPWHFYVVRKQEFKETIQTACWNQPQISSCSDLVVITAKIDEPVRREYYEQMFARRALSDVMLEKYLKVYQEYIGSLHSIYGWASRQCYIAATNMMTYAAMIGIDSCPIEGFEKEKVEEIMGFNTTKEQLAIILPFGYRANAPREKVRLPFDKVVTFQ